MGTEQSCGEAALSHPPALRADCWERSLLRWAGSGCGLSFGGCPFPSRLGGVTRVGEGPEGSVECVTPQDLEGDVALLSRDLRRGDQTGHEAWPPTHVGCDCP